MIVCVGGPLLAFPSSGGANIINLQCTFTLDSSFSGAPSYLAVGDQFSLYFPFDTAATDEMGGTTFARLLSMPGGATLVRESGLGIWNPGSGTLTGGQSYVFDNVSTPDSVQILAQYPSAGFNKVPSSFNYHFDLIEAKIEIQPASQGIVMDNGSGQTLDQLTGGSVVNMPWASRTVTLSFRDDDALDLYPTVTGTVTYFGAPVPEPASLFLCLAGGSLFLFRRRPVTR